MRIRARFWTFLISGRLPPSVSSKGASPTALRGDSRCANASTALQSSLSRCPLRAGPCAMPTTSMPMRSSSQAISSTFQGTIPVNGSGPKLPSLARPASRPESSMPLRALRRAASSCEPARAVSRVKVPSRSVSNPLTCSIVQPRPGSSAGAMTRSLPCWVSKAMRRSA